MLQTAPLIHKVAGSVSTTPKLTNNVPGNIAGTRFEDIQNPYTNLPRQQTFWDRVANWFGARSGYDKAVEQYQMASDEYNAQLSQLASEEAYNTPAEQAKRMRQAGLNPDLTGVSGEAASEFDNQQQSPDVSAGPDFGDTVSSIGNTVLSAITGTMAIMKDFQSLKQMRIANDSNDLSLAGQMLDFLTKSDPLYHQYTYPSYDENGNPVSSISLDDFARTFFRSKRNVKRFQDLRKSASESLLGYTNTYKSFSDFYDSAERLGKIESQPWMSNFAPGVSTGVISSVLRPLNEVIWEQNMRNAKLASKEAKYKSDVIDNLNAETEAQSIVSGQEADISESGARIAESEARKAIAPIRVDQTKIYGAILKGLNKFAESGDIGAQILSFLIGSKILQDPISKGIDSGKKLVKGAIDLVK